MGLPTDQIANERRPLSQTAQAKTPGELRLFLLGLVTVVLLYALPLVLTYVRQGKLLYAETLDDTLYETRIIDLYRGGTLGNPYLAEHQDSPRYMPELVERAFAGTSRVTGITPLVVVAISRVLLPTLIFVIVWSLGGNLGLEPLSALLAGLLATLAHSLSLEMGALRYFRVISPVAHVFLLMTALWLVFAAWRDGSRKFAVLAGMGLGLLFYAPVYYWSFAVLGTGLLALLAHRPARVALLFSVVIAIAIGSFNLVRSERMAADPEVKETLARLTLMVPGRALESGALPRLLPGLGFVAMAWWFSRKSLRWAQFLFPFAVAGSFMLVQNAITNRQIQAYHMINCLIPVWAILAVGLFQTIMRARPVLTLAAAGVVVGVGLFVQISSFFEWQRTQAADPEEFALNTLMPQTLEWLNRHTPPGSVLLAPVTITSSLLLFTHNRSYIAHYAFQYVMSNRELDLRYLTAQTWSPGKTLPYRADYFLGRGAACEGLPPTGVVYRNDAEGTCVFCLAP